MADEAEKDPEDDLDEEDVEDQEDEDEDDESKPTNRDAELSGRKAIREKLLDIFADVDRGFEDQAPRTNEVLDNWEMMNCILGGRQEYHGETKGFLPLIRVAVEARVTRFTNQLFPKSGRYVDCTDVNGDMRYAMIAMIEHYVRKAKLRTKVIPPLFRAGDCEGQWTIYVDWRKSKRIVTTRETKPVEAEGLEVGEVETIFEEEIEEGWPDVTVIPDPDLLILPATATGVDDALEDGGSVTIRRRWTKGKIRKMMADGEIAKKAGEELLENMTGPGSVTERKLGKAQANAAGIKMTGGQKHVQIYETWTKLKVDGEMRLCRTYYAGDEVILSAKLNPFWCDRCPIISAPLLRVADLARGRPPVSFVIDQQVAANDQFNMGMDTSKFSAMPIIMTDPVKNPRTESMILGLAALWETSPNDTKFAQFPPLWKDCLELISVLKQEIFQGLGVNPSMIPQSSGGRGKRNQAEVALEQQVDMLTTADVMTACEEGILNELLLRFLEYDHQFRDKPMTIRAFGPMGQQANMQEIPPVVMSNGYNLTWLGVEAARNAAERQQQIGWLNVLKSIPPQMMPGRKLDLTAAIETINLGVLGPRIAPLTFVNLAKEQSVPPEQENEMMESSYLPMVHPPDNDPEHMQKHLAWIQKTGDPLGLGKQHMTMHQQQIIAKNMAQQQSQQGPKGLPGSPGGAGPGAPGTPVPGSMPQAPKTRGPPGNINQDRLPAAGAVGMPRKM